MILRAPATGTLEWSGGSAWLALRDHCALLPVDIPPGARWVRPRSLAFVEAGEPVALVGDDETELEQCVLAQQRARDALRELLRGELRALERRASPLAAALLGPEREAVARRLAELEAEGQGARATLR